MIAIVFNDYPEEWSLLRSCVYGPAVVVLLSWILLRRCKEWVYTTLVLATISAAICLLMTDVLTRDWVELVRRIYDRPEIRAVWFAVSFPYVMIALFYLDARKRPNQPAPLNALDHPHLAPDASARHDAVIRKSRPSARRAWLILNHSAKNDVRRQM